MTGLVQGLLSGTSVWWVYAAVLVLPALESAVLLGFVVPGETVLVLAGIDSERGAVSIAPVIVLGILGALVGDSVGYAAGRRFGPRMRRTRAGRLVGEPRWQRGDGLILRYGGAAVLVARYTPFVRTVVPGAAGMARLSYRSFLAWNVPAGATWATLSVLAGWALGSVATSALSAFGVLLLVIALGCAVTLWRRHRA